MVRGLGDFQRGQIKHRDARVDRLFHHLHQALDTLQDILQSPYEPPLPPAKSDPTPPAEPAPRPAPPAPPAEPARPAKAYATVKEWVEISGMARSSTYKAMNDGHLTAVKVGRRTLIDVNAGLVWMRGQSYSPSRQVFGRS
jgi:hypothetical protein